MKNKIINATINNQAGSNHKFFKYKRSTKYGIGLIILAGVFCWGLSQIITWQQNRKEFILAETEEKSVLTNHEQFGKLPLYFIPNRGQENQNVDFILNTKQGKVFFVGGNEVVSVFQKQENDEVSSAGFDEFSEKETMIKNIVMKKKILNGNTNAQLVKGQKLLGKINYFLGDDPDKWVTDVEIYSSMKYEEVYDGIDVVYRGAEGDILEYDFIVKPQSDPMQIMVEYEGVELSLSEDGDLIISKDGNELTREKKPYIFQEIDGKKKEVDGGYLLIDSNHFSFWIGEYDKANELIIDPLTLLYSTFLGGNGEDCPHAIKIDNNGNIYIGGRTQSSDFPILNEIDPLNPPNYDGGVYLTNIDGFVSKFNSDGDLIYSSYIGGGSYDYLYDIDLYNVDNIIAIGSTSSNNFPVISGSYQTTQIGNYDGFLLKLNANGNALVFSTYFGGTDKDTARSLKVDSLGNSYITGYTNSSTSESFPIIGWDNSLGGTTDAFVIKFNATGTGLIYSTYVGGSATDYGLGIEIDGNGNSYIFGYTSSSTFPVLNAHQSVYAGNNDWFLTKLNANGDGLLYSTFIGGTGQEIPTTTSNGYLDGDIAIDNVDNVYVTGKTSSADFYVSPGAYDIQYDYIDSFVRKYDLSLSGLSSLIYSTFLGGTNNDSSWGEDHSHAIEVDTNGNAYIVGDVSSNDFPVLNYLGEGDTEIGGTKQGGWSDGFLTKLNSDGTALIYSTYLGGSSDDYVTDITIDSSNNVFVTGETWSSDFPIVLGAEQVVKSAWSDVFLSKISLAASNIAPSAPVLVSPQDSTTVISTTPELYARYSDSNASDTGTTEYRISSGSASDCLNDINIVATGSSAETTLNPQTTKFVVTPALTDGQSYNWCARNNDGTSTSDWTTMGGFGVNTVLPSGLVYSTYLGGGRK